MKKVILIALAVLLMPVWCYAGSVQEAQKAVLAAKNAGGGVCTDANPAGDCTGFLVCQNFEGSGYDNSESWDELVDTGSIADEDYTSTVLRGSQSLLVDHNTGGYAVAYTGFTAGSPRYIFFRVRWTSWATDYAPTMEVMDNAIDQHTAFSLRTNSSGSPVLYHGSTTNSSCGSALSLGTTYYVWMDYTKGSGANGVANLYISTTRTKPGSPNCTITGGNGTYDAGAIFPQSSEGTKSIFDQILVSSSDIGTVCE